MKTKNYKNYDYPPRGGVLDPPQNPDIPDPYNISSPEWLFLHLRFTFFTYSRFSHTSSKKLAIDFFVQKKWKNLTSDEKFINGGFIKIVITLVFRPKLIEKVKKMTILARLGYVDSFKGSKEKKSISALFCDFRPQKWRKRA